MRTMGGHRREESAEGKTERCVPPHDDRIRELLMAPAALYSSSLFRNGLYRRDSNKMLGGLTIRGR